MAADTDEFIRLVAGRFRALGDPTRLGLMMMLKRKGELNVGDLVEASGLSQPSVSKHLATLRTAGLVAVRREGNMVFYALRSQEIASICDIMCVSLQEDHARLGAALKSVRGSAGKHSTRGGVFK